MVSCLVYCLVCDVSSVINVYEHMVLQFLDIALCILIEKSRGKSDLNYNRTLLSSCLSLSSLNKTVFDNDSITLEKDSGNHYSLRYGVDMFTGILPIYGF